MVEKIELAILFRKKNISDEITEFIPFKVIEGTYNKEDNWFSDNKDGLMYMHMEITPSTTVGYACRTTIEVIKDSIKKESIEKIKEEMFNYANQFTYTRDLNNGAFVLAVNKETGDETLFEDIDNIPYIDTNSSKPLNCGEGNILELTPIEIESDVRKTIKGQDEAIRKIVTALWTTMNFREMRKKNMLIIGPSGVGKTAIFEKIKTILDIPVVIFPVPGLSQAGYVGRSVDEILKQVFYEADGDLDVAENSIVILDEIDKIAQHGDASNDVSTSAVQNELLKIIEGCERYVETGNPTEPSFTIDTTNMIFIGTGAFQELFEKEKPKIGYSQELDKPKDNKNINTDRLINYGLKRELVGRLPIVVVLNSLGKPELKEIVTESDESELNATINALAILDIEIENLDEVIDIIVEDALNKQIGARGLVFTINNMFQEIFYEVGNNPELYDKVVIGKNIIEDPFDFTLIERETKKRVRKQNCYKK